MTQDIQIRCIDFFDQYLTKLSPNVQAKFYRKFKIWNGRRWDWTGTYSFNVLTTLLQNAQNEEFYSNK